MLFIFRMEIKVFCYEKTLRESLAKKNRLFFFKPFYHPHVIPDLYELSSVEHERRRFEDIFVHTMKVSRVNTGPMYRQK